MKQSSIYTLDLYAGDPQIVKYLRDAKSIFKNTDSRNRWQATLKTKLPPDWNIQLTKSSLKEIKIMNTPNGEQKRNDRACTKSRFWKAKSTANWFSRETPITLKRTSLPTKYLNGSWQRNCWVKNCQHQAEHEKLGRRLVDRKDKSKRQHQDHTKLWKVSTRDNSSRSYLTYPLLLYYCWNFYKKTNDLCSRMLSIRRLDH